MKNILTVLLIIILWAVFATSGFQGVSVIDLWIFLILGMLINMSLTATPKRLKKILGDDATAEENANIVPIFMLLLFIGGLYYALKLFISSKFTEQAPASNFAMNAFFIIVLVSVLGDASGFKA